MCTITNFIRTPNHLCQQCKDRLRNLEIHSSQLESEFEDHPSRPETLPISGQDLRTLIQCSNPCPLNPPNISPTVDIPRTNLTCNTKPKSDILLPSVTNESSRRFTINVSHGTTSTTTPSDSTTAPDNLTHKLLRFSQVDKLTATEIYTKPGIGPLDVRIYPKTRNSLTSPYVGSPPYKTDRSMSESPRQSIPRVSLGFSLSFNTQNQTTAATTVTTRNSNLNELNQDSSRTSISEAMVKVIGDGQKRDMSKRAASVPTGSANICPTSVTLPVKQDSLGDDESLMIMEDKQSGGGGGGGNGGVGGGGDGDGTNSGLNTANAVLTRRNIRSSNAGQALSDPRSKTCCFCWCCCCSCSCMRVRSTLNDSKRPSASNDPQSVMDALNIDEKIDLDDVHKWAESFDELMQSSAGRKMFREFLRSEYSEENIMFWLACEELKQETNLEILEEKARLIYEDFISILSPREVSLDSRVRELINANMIEPTPHIFDEAQLQIYTLMHRDSYPRFLNSRLYKDLLQEIKDAQT